MEHPNKDLLISYHFGELPEWETQEASKHLENCEECRRYLQSIGLIDDAFGHFIDVAVPGDAWANVMAAVKEADIVPEQQAVPFLLPQQTVWVLLSAAILAAAISLVPLNNVASTTFFSLLGYVTSNWQVATVAIATAAGLATLFMTPLLINPAAQSKTLISK